MTHDSPKLVVGLLLASVIACAPVDSVSDDAATRDLDAIVESAIIPLMEAFDIPGMAVGVVTDGRSRVFTFGVASLENGTPVHEGTLFELGSVSKVFTGAIAAYADAVGTLSLAMDSPGQHLGALQGRPIDGATLLHLGTYTAGGLPLQFPEEVASHEEMLAYFADWVPSNPPGQVREYSNPSVGLLGHIAARSLGGYFSEVVRQHLFEPMGLRSTYFDVPDSALSHYAWGYNPEMVPVRMRPGVLDQEAYGIRSSVEDMVRFLEASIDPRGLDDPLRGAIEATREGHFRVGAMEQGLGWERYPSSVSLDDLLAGNTPAMIFGREPVEAVAAGMARTGSWLHMKTGSTNGFGAYVLFIPEQRVGLVLLSNRNFPIPDRIRAAWRILDELVGDQAPEPGQNGR